MIRDRERDLNTDESASDSWSLCTVEQVESLKALLRVIPMWSTGIVMFLCLNQNSFSTLQAKTMDRQITRNFEIPAGSFTVFMIVTLTIWVAFYDRIMAPLLAKYTGRPQGLSTKVRMGIGLLLASAALAVGAITEAIRRRIAIEEGFVDSPNAVIDMSALWLVPQFALLGLAEAFNAIGQIEFYYTQLPKSMSSIAVAIFTLGTAVANLVGSLLVDIVNGITSKNGNESWLSSNLNKGHIDYYYGLISFLGFINFIYFCACCRFYGHAENEKTRCSEDIHNGQFDYSELPQS
jgi:peptide/histidine transporter 3/4